MVVIRPYDHDAVHSAMCLVGVFPRSKGPVEFETIIPLLTVYGFPQLVSGSFMLARAIALRADSGIVAGWRQFPA